MWKMVLWLRGVGDGGIDACLRAWVEKGRTWDSCSRGLSGSLWEGLFFYFFPSFSFHSFYLSRSLLIPYGGSTPDSNMDTNSLAAWKS